MANVKKNNKKKIIIPIAILLVIAVAVSGIVVTTKKNKIPEVQLASIATDGIVENVSATGDVTSGAVREYKVGSVATVKEVFVKTGDEVKEGALLATFDTAGLDSQAAQLQASYNSAKASYDQAAKNQKQAKKNLDAVNKQIKATEKKLDKARNTVPTTTTRQTTARQTTRRETTTRPATSIQYPTATTTTVPTTTANYSDMNEAFGALIGAIEEVSDQVTNIADSVEATNEITAIVMMAIAEELATGNYSADAIADAVSEAMMDAIEQGMIEFVDSGAAVDMISAAVESVDWESIGRGMGQDQNVQITSIELQLSALYAQKQIYTAAANEDVVGAQRAVMNSSKSALDAVKSAQEELSAGWTAAFDGTITECDIVAGEQTNVLSSGIKLENMNKLIVTISLGEYDVHKVKVGMPANIKTAYGTYTGEVATIAPTATGGSNSSIMDSVGSMAGISGLSSLTASGAGVKCEITVDDPDENIIIGFEASVDIQTSSHEAVPVVPIESIILEKEGTFVYLYNEEEGTVTKTQIETGAISDTAYEIKSGLNLGDKIVAIPSSDFKEETFEVRVK